VVVVGFRRDVWSVAAAYSSSPPAVVVAAAAAGGGGCSFGLLVPDR